MRISDWSSDVCSSDLLPLQSRSVDPWRDDRRRTPTDRRGLPERWLRRLQDAGGQGNLHHWQDEPRSRSEEHTSELQSLMRISYAVFCLKKKNTNQLNKYHTREQYNHHKTQLDD